jgi:hypothetical protein
MNAGRIRHTVSFTLHHPAGSDEERDFLAAAEKLGEIPGVEAFEILAEVSPKNDFRFGISMEFADQAAYDGYNAHPEHRSFVEERWLQEVSDFLEIDYAAGG